MIPILLRPTDWSETPFKKLQVLPTNAKPITKWQNRDDAFLNVAMGIRTAVNELNAKLSTEPPQIQVHQGQDVPLWNAPYRRNPFFTGREDILKHLHDTLRAYPKTGNFAKSS